MRATTRCIDGHTIRSVDGAFETTDPKQGRLLGVFVMTGIALLQLGTEYFGTRDASRFLSKAMALLVGLPLLIVWAFAVFRWASRKRFGVLGPLFVGAVTAGLFFAGLLLAARAAAASLTPLRPHPQPLGGGDGLRAGFAVGVTSYAPWGPAVGLPPL